MWPSTRPSFGRRKDCWIGSSEERRVRLSLSDSLPSQRRRTVLRSRGSRAGMRWSVPELVTNSVTNPTWEKFPDGQLCERNGGLGRD
jgi:hypothetical protein